MFKKLISSDIFNKINIFFVYNIFQYIIKTKTHFNPLQQTSLLLLRVSLLSISVLISSFFFKFFPLLIIIMLLSFFALPLFGISYFSLKVYKNRFYYFSIFLNKTYNTDAFSISNQQILQYKKEDIILEEDHDSQKKEYIVLKKSILDSRMSVQYNPYNEYSGKTTAKDTIIFDNCDVEEVIYMISLIDTFLINKNPAQQILARLKL